MVLAGTADCCWHRGTFPLLLDCKWYLEWTQDMELTPGNTWGTVYKTTQPDYNRGGSLASTERGGGRWRWGEGGEGEDEERGGGKWKVKMRRGRRVHHRTRAYLLNMVPWKSAPPDWGVAWAHMDFAIAYCWVRGPLMLSLQQNMEWFHPSSWSTKIQKLRMQTKTFSFLIWST